MATLSNISLLMIIKSNKIFKKYQMGLEKYDNFECINLRRLLPIQKVMNSNSNSTSLRFEIQLSPSQLSETSMGICSDWKGPYI